MQNKPTTENAKRFLAQNPTFIGRVGDTDYYESPKYGDEVPLRAITKYGELKYTDWWELPNPIEIDPAKGY